MKNLENILIACRVDDLSVNEAMSEIAIFIREQTHAILEAEHSALIQDEVWESRQSNMGRMADVLNRRLDRLTQVNDLVVKSVADSTDVSNPPELNQLIYTQVLELIPEKLSVDNLDPKENINRREYAIFCHNYNQALDDMTERIKAKYIGGNSE